MNLAPWFRWSGRLAVVLLSFVGALVAQDAPVAPKDEGFSKPDHPPKVIKRSPPIYPRNLRMAGVVGEVKVAFVVDETGRVVAAHAASSNNPWFERPAIEAVKRWKFEPATKNGKPVKTRAMQLIGFELDERHKQNFWRVPAIKEPEKLPPQFRWKTAPEPTSTAFPLYPTEALLAKQKGHTKIRFMVGPKGRVEAAQLLEASAPEFGHATLAMIDRWHFKPAKFADGSPAYAMLAIEHDFTPDGRGDVPVTDEAMDVLRLVKNKPEKIVAWADLDRAPKPIWQHAPVYPTALHEKGEPGRALIEFYVDENGDAQLPGVVEASAPEFGYAAAQAVATWRFEAPLKDGKPVCTRIRVPLEFKVKETRAAAPVADK